MDHQLQQATRDFLLTLLALANLLAGLVAIYIRDRIRDKRGCKHIDCPRHKRRT